MIGALEAGGTKMVCAIFSDQGALVDRVSYPTETPIEVMPKIIAYFKQYPELKAIGVGSFGPIGVNPELESFGYITTTPKLAWQHYNLYGTLKEALPLPIAWTTDVNAAAYGELRQGAAQDVKNCLYLTVGTGIGGGVVVNEKVVEGYAHPEAGHMLLMRNEQDDYEGFCPYHKNCAESLAAGPAIEGRWGKKAIELTDNPEVWELEAEYLAQALYNYYVTLSSERFILGGGVMKQSQLFPLIRAKFAELNNGYLELPELESFIVPPQLGDNAGITGCYELAKDLIEANV
ncbi:ROK family protein [Fundicoccus culcitae]|uniref:fructokinase n=1 Tax=Fundicoccus culcitae TaxID=2969821 RepID=A0ABY5P506_9LACT|nr:ROK family protein [Fundicoccus culcitae]UUX33836.1 ROK family protein [Fundicoccus culcitae]